MKKMILIILVAIFLGGCTTEVMEAVTPYKCNKKREAVVEKSERLYVSTPRYKGFGLFVPLDTPKIPMKTTICDEWVEK